MEYEALLPVVSYKVLIRCNTYNQSKYIVDALDGFTKQQTSFPYVCLVIDDCSLDGEQGIITQWLQENCRTNSAKLFQDETTRMIVVKSRTNDNCTFCVHLLKENLFRQGARKGAYALPWREKSEYVAWCEGDDYWTDERKLQKQVGFLDTHPNYTMCFHNAIQHWTDSSQPDSLFSNIENRNYSGVELHRKWIVPTASVVMRSSVLCSELYTKAINCKKFIFGDILLFLSSAALGQIRGMSDTMSIYRRCQEGAVMQVSRSPEKMLRLCHHTLAIYEIFGDQYKKDAEYIFHRRCYMQYIRSKANGAPDVAKQFWELSVNYSRWGHYSYILGEYWNIIVNKFKSLVNG